MRRRSRGIAGTIALCALAGLVLSGCIPVYVPPSYGVYADTVPPDPYVEEVPPAPGPDYVWANGYWYWNGVTYVWIRGHWVLRPYPGYVWLSSGWVLSGGHYVFVPGRWSRPGHRVVPHYVHPVPSHRRGSVYRAIPRHQARPAPKARPAHPARPAHRR